MFAACLTHGKQTNHCKMTMVWWENDISILFAVLQRSRDWGSRDSVCVCTTLRLGQEKPLYCRFVESIVVWSLIKSEISGDEEVRVGVEKDRRKKSSGSDIGWFRSRDVVQCSSL